MDIFAHAIEAVMGGVDPLVVIALVCICVIMSWLRDLVKLQGETNVELRNLTKIVDQNGQHQTSRMEEIRRFMVTWWERFAPLNDQERRDR